MEGFFIGRRRKHYVYYLFRYSASGNLTLGNYLGALRNFLRELQDANECYYCIVNQHAITVPQDRSFSMNRPVSWQLFYRCRLDPQKATLFVQSEVPEHVQLGWIMITSSYVGELERMTRLEQKTLKRRAIPSRPAF